MLYNEYGSTGISVSAVGFGGMRFADIDNVEQCAALVRSAYDKGINYFDTAPGYFAGKSEERFGAAFAEMKKTRDEKPFYVSTKTFASKPDEIRRELEASLKRMGLDYVDFFHMWCILTPENFEQRKADGALEGFAKLKEEGLAKHICISSHMTGPEIGSVLRDYPFEGVLLGYNVTNFAFREAGLQVAADTKKGVVVMNPLGGGMIPMAPDRFEFVKTQDDETVVEGALRFVINDPRITVALVGTDTEDNLQATIKAVDGFKPIPESEINRIRASLGESMNGLCTSCGYCDKCPQEVPVPKMMNCFNQYVLHGDDKQAMLNHMRWHWGMLDEGNNLDKCVECGLCEQACTQKLPIIDRLRFMRGALDDFKKKMEESKG